ncbi:MAG: prolipoprotein diacylglyceryl transferase [Piscirickettsiaceae bacterium]|nr:prolipoprotein diacylglyceryl transferase [Piscirickettsiaceae bacterium]
MVYPQIDSVAISLGPLQIHWYGLTYLFGFVGAWLLGCIRAKCHDWTLTQVGDLLFYCSMGVIIGGRFGYIICYDLSANISQPLNIIKIWQGGMSFHGGLLGVCAAFWWFAKDTGGGLFMISDFIAPLVPIGLLTGRIGNFINNELWGKVSDVPWSMVFPNGGSLSRHPSQIYEAGLEGIILFIILWLYSSKIHPIGAVSGFFLLGYGCFRFLVEFLRIPDPQYGYLAFDWLTLGQLLSLPMVTFGIYLIGRTYHR